MTDPVDELFQADVHNGSAPGLGLHVRLCGLDRVVPLPHWSNAVAVLDESCIHVWHTKQNGIVLDARCRYELTCESLIK